MVLINEWSIASTSPNDTHMNATKIFIHSFKGEETLTAQAFTWNIKFHDFIGIRQTMNCPFHLKATLCTQA
jgi:hypothetical protein